MNQRILFFVAIFLFTIPFVSERAVANPGDTTHVTVISKYLWTGYGQQDRWAVFPDSGSKRYQKVLMRYTLTCPSPSCGQWDYTNKAILLQHTGIIDSTLQEAPNFTVNGNMVDTFHYSLDTLKTYSFNKTTKQTDSAAESPVTIYFYQSKTNRFLATDSVTAWQAGYWNHYYDTAGKTVDSFYVAGDSELVLDTSLAYDHYEVINNIEIGRYITPYGQWFGTGWTYTWTYDVTDYAFLLHDSVQIRSLYEGYSQGSLYTLSFDMIEGTPPADAYNLKVLAFGDFPYGSASNPISNYFPPWRIALDSTADVTTLRLITTGHGEDDNDADEFTPHTNSIWVNGMHAYDQFLWRTDCGQNPVWPQAGTWYYQRSGWCPGDAVNYWDYDLTPFGTKGDSITVQYKVDPYTSPNGGPYLITSIQQISKHGPNFQNDVRLEDIYEPNNAQQFNRMNPICEEGPPFIVIRNTGKNVLTSASIQYGHDSTIQNTYNWTGSLNFMDTAQVWLPPVDLGDSGTHTFTVIVGLPNGQPDEYTPGDTITTTYVLPQSYTNRIYIKVKTDSIGYGIPNGISYQIEDLMGNEYLYNGNINDNTLTIDTVTLPNGCYQFTIFDSSDGIGLIPIFPGSLSGYYTITDSITKSKRGTIISAVADFTNAAEDLASFGNQQITTFNIGGSPSSVSEYIQPSQFELTVWPNPASTDITLDLSSLSSVTTPATVQIFDVLGHSLVTRIVNPSDFGSVSLPINSLADGSYIVLVRAFGVRASQRFVVKH